MHGRFWLSSVGVAAGVAALVGAAAPGTVGQDSTGAVAAVRGDTLRIGRSDDLTLDPALLGNADSPTIAQATCALLYNFRDLPAPEGLRAVPEVAKAPPKVSKDGKTNTIVLKRTHRFHTGQRVTAASFVAAFNRDASPKMGSPAADFLHEFVGADAVIAGQADSISGVKALGRYKLRIRTTRRLPDLVDRLALPLFCPIARSTPLREIDPPKLGSGPYYVASHLANRQAVLERNPFYGGRRRAHAKRIVWMFGLGGEACRAAVERNEVDYCAGLGVPFADYAELARKYGMHGPRFFSNPELRTDYYAFNHDRPAFRGPGQIPLKKAINLALDRHAFVRASGFPVGRSTDQILPRAIGPDAAIYPTGGVTRASLSKARALVRKARLRPAKLVVYTFNSPQGLAEAEIFKRNLKRIGIDVEVSYFSTGELFDRIGTRGEQFDIARAGIIADYPDGIGFFRYLDGRNIRPKGNGNVAYFNRARYNRRIAAIDRLRGRARRKAWADLDVELMRNDPPWAPVTNFARRDFVSKSFGCYVFQPVFSRVDLVAACKK